MLQSLLRWWQQSCPPSWRCLGICVSSLVTHGKTKSTLDISACNLFQDVLGKKNDSHLWFNNFFVNTFGENEESTILKTCWECQQLPIKGIRRRGNSMDHFKLLNHRCSRWLKRWVGLEERDSIHPWLRVKEWLREAGSVSENTSVWTYFVYLSFLLHAQESSKQERNISKKSKDVI